MVGFVYFSSYLCISFQLSCFILLPTWQPRRCPAWLPPLGPRCCQPAHLAGKILHSKGRFPEKQEYLQCPKMSMFSILNCMLGCKAPFLKSPFVVPALKCCLNQCLRCFKKGDQLALWGWEGRGNSDNSYFSGTLPVGTSAWANLARHFYLGASIHIGQSSKNRYFWSQTKIVG